MKQETTHRTVNATFQCATLFKLNCRQLCVFVRFPPFRDEGVSQVLLLCISTMSYRPDKQQPRLYVAKSRPQRALERITVVDCKLCSPCLYVTIPTNRG